MPDVLPQRRMLPTLLLLVAAASWGGNWVAARAVYLDVPPFALVFWRWALAAALIFPFAAAQLREDAPLIRRHLPALAAFGVIGTAGFTMFGYWGIRYTTAINATLLNASLLLLLAGALLWAIYTVLLKWRPPIQPLSFVFFTVAAGAAFSLPFYLGEIAAGATMVVSPKTAVAIGYLAVFPSVVAYICWNRAVPIVGPNVAGFFNPVIPVFGTLFAVVLLDERLALYHLAGFALVLGGVVLTSKR